MPRLDAFLEPFIESMARQEQYDHASTYVKGLLSDLEQKNVESIAYRFGQERLGLQKFIIVQSLVAQVFSLIIMVVIKLQTLTYESLKQKLILKIKVMKARIAIF